MHCPTLDISLKNGDYQLKDKAVIRELYITRLVKKISIKLGLLLSLTTAGGEAGGVA
jgi:hypothetical protein